jgi:hypothetical protein
MEPFCTFWAWVTLNSEALQGMGAVGTFVAVALAAVQLREATTHRDISDSLGFVNRIDQQLQVWSTTGGSLDELMNTLEVTATLLNRGKLSSTAKYLLRPHVETALSVICLDPAAAQFIAEDSKEHLVYLELRLFLIRNYAQIARGERMLPVLRAHFSADQFAKLHGNSLGAKLRRTQFLLMRR